MTSPSLDVVDMAILRVLQHDARLSQAALGAEVGLSAAAVNRRIRRLTGDGYIRQTSAVLEPRLLGHPLTVIVQLELVSEETHRLDQVQQELVACPNVQQCYYVAGEWDFVLTMLVPDMDRYRQLTRELFFASGNVKRFKTLVVMNHAKVSLDVPVAGL